MKNTVGMLADVLVVGVSVCRELKTVTKIEVRRYGCSYFVYRERNTIFNFNKFFSPKKVD